MEEMFVNTSSNSIAAWDKDRPTCWARDDSFQVFPCETVSRFAMIQRNVPSHSTTLPPRASSESIRSGWPLFGNSGNGFKHHPFQPEYSSLDTGFPATRPNTAACMESRLEDLCRFQKRNASTGTLVRRLPSQKRPHTANSSVTMKSNPPSLSFSPRLEVGQHNRAASTGEGGGVGGRSFEKPLSKRYGVSFHDPTLILELLSVSPSNPLSETIDQCYGRNTSIVTPSVSKDRGIHPSTDETRGNRFLPLRKSKSFSVKSLKTTTDVERIAPWTVYETEAKKLHQPSSRSRRHRHVSKKSSLASIQSFFHSPSKKNSGSGLSTPFTIPTPFDSFTNDSNTSTTIHFGPGPVSIQPRPSLTTTASSISLDWDQLPRTAFPHSYSTNPFPPPPPPPPLPSHQQGKLFRVLRKLFHLNSRTKKQSAVFSIIPPTPPPRPRRPSRSIFDLNDHDSEIVPPHLYHFSAVSTTR